MSRRTALIAGLAVSLALVVGLSISLLGGVGNSSSRTASVVPQQQFFGIAQGLSRFDSEDLQTMAATGVGADRFLLDWGVVQPNPGGSFIWPDEDVGALASHGIRLVPYLWGSPPWVAATPAQPPVDSVQQEEAWRRFVEAAVARYGPGGSYWAHDYRQQYGADAKPLPIQYWQIWNEPNLKKFFTPGEDIDQSAQKYARLLEISHDAITSEDPKARIVLAGLPGTGDVTAWDFLDSLYQVPGTKTDFDAAALHPYAPNVAELEEQVERVRATMTKHGGQRTPLWFTELGWGSAPLDRFRLNKGLPGQALLLTSSFKLILSRRSAWNVQRVFWFDWRDPGPATKVASTCSFCGSAGLLSFNRNQKPSYLAFKGFAAAR